MTRTSRTLPPLEPNTGSARNDARAVVSMLCLGIFRGRARNVNKSWLAEAVRFELTNDLRRCRFSRPVHSTALPSFRGGV